MWFPVMKEKLPRSRSHLGVNWGCDVVLGVRRCGIERIGGVDVVEMGL